MSFSLGEIWPKITDPQSENAPNRTQGPRTGPAVEPRGRGPPLPQPSRHESGRWGQEMAFIGRGSKAHPAQEGPDLTNPSRHQGTGRRRFACI